MKMVNPRLLDPYAKEFKVLCSSASSELRACGAIRDRVDEQNEVHKMCFRGADLVSWMMSSGYCETKLHATQIGTTMLRAGAIWAISSLDTFLGDSRTFYRVKDSQSGRLRKVSSKIFGRSISLSPQSLLDSSFDDIGSATDNDTSVAGQRSTSLLRGSQSRLNPRDQPPPQQVARRSNVDASRRRGSIEMVYGFVPGLEDRQSRRILKENTKKNRSRVSRETQLRVLVNSVEGEQSESSGALEESLVEDMTFPEIGIERGRSKIKFSDTIHVREIVRDPTKKEPKEYQRYLDPEEEEPTAYQFAGVEPASDTSYSSNLV